MSTQTSIEPTVETGDGEPPRFAVTGREQPGTGNMETALQRNRAFAAAGGHEGAVVFPKLRLFVVTCMDPRVDPAHFLGLGLSDALVVRNVGGRVTPAVINDVAFIGQIAENVQLDGPLFEVAVIHHTQCGAGAFADEEFRRSYARRIGTDESDLRDQAVVDPAATVTRDVERLRAAPAISPRVIVSGHVYDVVTGLVQTILPARNAADNGGVLERPDASPGAPEVYPLDPTQGRQIGSEPYDDPTQGRQIGSDPYDDPTRGRWSAVRA